MRDTGIGIPKSKLDSIFEAFEQVDTTLTRRFGGTGLGLAICRELTEMMHGRIWVESTPSEGSVFHFTGRFPYTIGDEELQESIPVKLQGIQTLVVDDNDTSRRILAEMLQSWGLIPTSVSRAREALDKLQAIHDPPPAFELLVADISMPDMDGFTLVEQVRELPQWRNLLVVLLTSTQVQNEFEQCERLQVSAQVAKPVKQSDLLDAITRVVGTHRNRGERRPANWSNTGKEQLPHLRILLAEDSLMNQKLALGLLQTRPRCNRRGRWTGGY